MDLSKSQLTLLDRLKTRGPQSVKILSNQLAMTTMGVRQHLLDLQQKGLITQTEAEKQTRGRPIHLWTLTKAGHARYPDQHAQIAVELIQEIQSSLGQNELNSLIDSCAAQTASHYKQSLANAGLKLEAQIHGLADLRNREGYMAEVRLLPDGWLLIENHCPIYSAAKTCQHYCKAELETFRLVLGNQAMVERVDHLPSGARRCAYKITPK